MTTYKPASVHNPLMGPAVCLCVDCSRSILEVRCKATNPDGIQCGNYKGHRGSHTMLVATTFAIAAERAAP